ncbi:ACT domain-containing protein [Tepidibacillus marianensis]|uniref:ACT domain-containing protein n=1 Tax=Tepidibacillus marianensis TaxID=3131995 RepID=UPI0030CFF7E3
MSNKKEEEVFYLVRSDILPEAILKTIEAKKLLQKQEVETVNEAVKRVGLSRSDYYKYKEGIFPFNAMMREKIVTISMDLEHQSGTLSKMLSYIAQVGGNVLTINQTIPLQEIANIVLSIDTAPMEPGISELLDGLKEIKGVRRVQLIGRG